MRNKGTSEPSSNFRVGVQARRQGKIASSIERSQNHIEEEFLTTLSSRLPKGIKLVQIADRGYGKSILLKNRLQRKELFIIRGKRDVVINYEENKKTCRKSLGRLKLTPLD